MLLWRETARVRILPRTSRFCKIDSLNRAVKVRFSWELSKVMQLVGEDGLLNGDGAGSNLAASAIKNRFVELVGVRFCEEHVREKTFLLWETTF